MSDNPFAAYMIASNREKATSPPTEPIVDGPFPLALPNTPTAQPEIDSNPPTETATTVPPIVEAQTTTVTPSETVAEPPATTTVETTTEEPLETLEAEILFLELEETAATTTVAPTEPQIASNQSETATLTSDTLAETVAPLPEDEFEDPSEEVFNGGTIRPSPLTEDFPEAVHHGGTFAPEGELSEIHLEDLANVTSASVPAGEDPTGEEGLAAQFNQSLPPKVFSEGTFAPEHFDNFTLPPELMETSSEDLPWFFQGGTVAPDFAEDGILPPFLMAGGTFAPGLVQNGVIDLNFIQDDWAKDLIPDMNGFNLDSSEKATPVFRARPFFEFKGSPVVSKVSAIPRFGMTNDFASLGYLMNDEQTGKSGESQSSGVDYIIGLSFLAGGILVFFLIWWFFLLISKCCCRNFLSGSPFTIPGASSADSSEEKKLAGDVEVGESASAAEEDESVEMTKKEASNEDQEGMKLTVSVIQRRAKRTRIVFSIAALIQITFALLLVLKGIPNLYETTQSMQSTFVTAREILGEAKDVLILVRAAREMSASLRDRLTVAFDAENPCPGFETFSTSSMGVEITDAVDSTISELAKLAVDLDDGVEALDEGLIDSESNIDAIDESLQSSKNNEIIGYMIALPFLFLACIMLLGTIAAQRNAMPSCVSCFLNWVVLPLFVLVTLLSTIVCIVFMLTVAMNSDFCGASDSTPDETILNFMINSGKFKASDATYTMVEYYLYQCTARATEDPLMELRQIDNDIVKTNDVITNFTDAMSDASIGKISFGCQKDFAPLFDTFRSMKDLTGIARKLIADGLELLNCERITSMYEELIYEGTCTYSVQGFAWCASCLFIVALMGMVMITLRSSYQNTILPEVDLDLIETKDLDDSDGMMAATSGEEDILGSSSGEEEKCVARLDDDSITIGENAFDTEASASEATGTGGEKNMEDFSVGGCETVDVEEGTPDNARRT